MDVLSRNKDSLEAHRPKVSLNSAVYKRQFLPARPLLSFIGSMFHTLYLAQLLTSHPFCFSAFNAICFFFINMSISPLPFPSLPFPSLILSTWLICLCSYPFHHSFFLPLQYMPMGRRPFPMLSFHLLSLVIATHSV